MAIECPNATVQDVHDECVARPSFVSPIRDGFRDASDENREWSLVLAGHCLQDFARHEAPAHRDEDFDVVRGRGALDDISWRFAIHGA
jgi:hypothetical protein